jgi:hypothetical protein
MTLNGLDALLGEAHTDATSIQNENRTREMAMVIRSIEDAQDKLWRLMKAKS